MARYRRGDFNVNRLFDAGTILAANYLLDSKRPPRRKAQPRKLGYGRMPKRQRKSTYKKKSKRQRVTKSTKGGRKLGGAGRKARPAKKPYAMRRRIRNLSKKVHNLISCNSQSIGTMVSRFQSSYRTQANTGAKSVSFFTSWDNDIIRQLLTKTKIYNTTTNQFEVKDSSNPQTGVTQCFVFPRVCTSLMFRNNFQTDNHVQIYSCVPKDDTDIDVRLTWNQALIAGSSNVDYNGAVPTGGNAVQLNGVFITDMPAVLDAWNIKRVFNKVLKPGHEGSVTHIIKDCTYRPDVQQATPFNFKPLNKSHQWLVIMNGRISHLTAGTTADVSMNKVGLDFIEHRTAVLKYNAGGRVKYYDIEVSVPTTATGYTENNKPNSTQVQFAV